MTSMSQLKAKTILDHQNQSLFTTTEIAKLLGITNTNTVYKYIDRMKQNQILTNLRDGKFQMTHSTPHDFAKANFLYSPSYISLETALAYYGIISQFPFMVTSVTTKRSQVIELEKDYEYTKLSPKLFWGYQKQDTYLIATPEKALLDMAYLSSKGLRQFSTADLDLELVNKKIWHHYIQQVSYSPLKRWLKTQNL